MNSRILFIITGLFFIFFAAQANAISQTEEKKVLLLLNNFCGDAWCEGAYDIHFKSIQFNSSHKAYVLAAATTADSSDESTASSIPFHCEIPDAQIFLDTLHTSHGEQLYEAERRLFEIISNCIDTALYIKP